MAERYARELLRRNVAQMCQAIGWNVTQSTPVDLLTDVLEKYIRTLGADAARYAENSGRTEPNLDDLGQVFQDRRIFLPELDENMRIMQFTPSSLPIVPFPCPKESNLNFLKPGSHESLTRLMHVHEHLPPMYPERELTPPVSDKVENRHNIHNVSHEISVTDSSKKDLFKRPLDPPALPRKLTPPVSDKVEKRHNGHNVSHDISVTDSPKKDIFKRLLDAPVLPRKLTPPVSDKVENRHNGHNVSHDISVTNSPKKDLFKRPLDPPALPRSKRMRVNLEESYPRELSSVTMTMSGNLLPTREGKLPTSTMVSTMPSERHPRNDDFKSKNYQADKVTSKPRHRSRKVKQFLPPEIIFDDTIPIYQEHLDHTLHLDGGADVAGEAITIPIPQIQIEISPRVHDVSSTYIPRAIVPPENIHPLAVDLSRNIDSTRNETITIDDDSNPPYMKRVSDHIQTPIQNTNLIQLPITTEFTKSTKAKKEPKPKEKRGKAEKKAKNPVICSLFPNSLANLFDSAEGLKLITGHVYPVKRNEFAEGTPPGPSKPQPIPETSISEIPREKDIPEKKKEKLYKEKKEKNDLKIKNINDKKDNYMTKADTRKVKDDAVVGQIKKKKKKKNNKKIAPYELDGPVNKLTSRLGFPSLSNEKSSPMQCSISYYTDKLGNKVWLCAACGQPDNGSSMIGCDGCGCHYHWQCVGITVHIDLSEDWFCNFCTAKRVMKKEKKKDKKKAKRPKQKN